MNDRSQIDAWWEDPKTVSLLDKNLRALETSFVCSNLNHSYEFADFGCGDAESTIQYAPLVKSCLALERSNTLRERAKARIEEGGLSNVRLVAGDVRELTAFKGAFDCVCTQRVVINFLSWPEQQEVLTNIWTSLRPGGRYLMVENTVEGFDALNAARRSVGLADLKIHHWHNLYLHHDKLIEWFDGKYVLERRQHFNLYYLLTRVFTNMFAQFEGFGANAKKDPIFGPADSAARRLFEIFGEHVKIEVPTGNAFGPIQGFVLRRL